MIEHPAGLVGGAIGAGLTAFGAGFAATGVKRPEAWSLIVAIGASFEEIHELRAGRGAAGAQIDLGIEDDGQVGAGEMDDDS